MAADSTLVVVRMACATRAMLKERSSPFTHSRQEVTRPNRSSSSRKATNPGEAVVLLGLTAGLLVAHSLVMLESTPDSSCQSAGSI